MPNSLSWNRDFFILHSPEYVSRHFKIKRERIKDFDSFLIAPNGFTKEGLFFETQVSKVYPLQKDDEVRIRRLLNHPILSEIENGRDFITLRTEKMYFNEKRVMAIANMTPDSFYPQSRIGAEQIEEYLDMVKDSGIDILDVGGESTRPGSDPVSHEEEWSRIKKTIELALDRRIKVSVDTYHPETAEFALEMGVHMINDVTGLENEEIGKLCKKFSVPLVIMHKKGDFKTMQDNPSYENVLLEILQYFYERILRARKIGIEDNIILDPGIGFGKRVEDNLDIIRYLHEFKMGHPLMIGLSRKGFIGKLLGESVDDRDISTVIFNAISMMNGADIIRVHDIGTSMELKKIMNIIKND